MTRILIADDHAVVREGIKRVIEKTSDLTLVGEAINGRDALDQLCQTECDVLLLDVTMPEMSGLEVLQRVRQKHPKVAVLVLSMHPEDEVAVAALKAGAAGYMSKESAPTQLVAAIRKVAAGGKYITGPVAERLVAELAYTSGRPPHTQLSNREYQVLCMIASGKAVSDIAAVLLLSVKTISTFRARILEKMNLKNNAELTTYAIKNRLVV